MLLRSDIGDIFQLLFLVVIVAVPALIQYLQKKKREEAARREGAPSTSAMAPPAPAAKRRPRVLSTQPAGHGKAQAESIEDVLSELFGGEPLRPATPPPLSPPKPPGPQPEPRVPEPAPEPREEVARISADFAGLDSARLPSELRQAGPSHPPVSVPAGHATAYDLIQARAVHPIVRDTLRQGALGWQRAIVLKEVLDPPIGLR
jgi:hypothetical protein